MDHMTDIKTAIKQKKLCIGTKSVLANLKTGKLARVYLASNASADVAEDIARLAEMCSAEVIRLQIPNEEIGTVCKKSFSVSALGVLN